jgi:hypothetical protein
MTGSGKDREKHSAARGVKKVTRKQLMAEIPDPKDMPAYLKMLHFDADDRGCAIMGGGLVEHYLTQAIKCRLIDPGAELAGEWFTGTNAPFATFSAKIQLGMAIGIYGPLMHGQLTAIKDIRNVFAHRALPLTFDHPALMDSILKLAPFLKGSKENKYKLVFATGCVSIGDALINDAADHAGRDMETSFP